MFLFFTIVALVRYVKTENAQLLISGSLTYNQLNDPVYDGIKHHLVFIPQRIPYSHYIQAVAEKLYAAPEKYRVLLIKYLLKTFILLI
jgi:hypothetical protein